MDNVVQLDMDQVDDITVIKIANKRFDASIAPDFNRQIEELVAAGNLRIVLELSNVEFMDSSGLGAIVGSYKKVQGSGDMTLCGMQPSVKTIFQLTHMDRILSIFDSLEACLNKKSA